MNSMDKTKMRNDKWTQPGWRIEQKYGKKVLIGNWLEERLQFTREPKTASSTNRMDYRPQWESTPDVSVKHSGLRRAEGLPSKLFFTHHSTPAFHHMVTLYDESYGRKNTSAPPTLRSWNHDSLSWQPEKSDHPISAPPTNFGLLESKKHCLGKQQWLSAYRSAYQRHPLSAFGLNGFARAPRALSSHLHAANHDNKDLDLRRRSMLQVPDHCPRLLPSIPRPPPHA